MNSLVFKNHTWFTEITGNGVILSTWLYRGISGDVSGKPASHIQKSNRHIKLKW